MPPLPIASSASTAELFTHHAGQSQNQVQNLFFAGHSAGRSQTLRYFNPLQHKASRWSFVGYSFVVLFVSHRLACSSIPCEIRLSGYLLFVNPFVGHSFRHAKYPTCVTNIQPCGSYGGQSYRQPQILFAQNSPYFALYVVFIFTPIFIAHFLYL